MSRWLLLLCVLLARTAKADVPRDPDQYLFDQSLGDFQEELAQARDQGKQGVMLFFEMDECPFCHRMKETILNQPKVQDYFKANFLIFKVDIEGDIPITDFQGNATTEKEFAFREHRVRATPVFLFFDLEGKQVARYTGATADQQEFMWLGQYVVDAVYKEMPFAKFKREQRTATR